MPARKRPIQPAKGKDQAAVVGGKKKKQEKGSFQLKMPCYLLHFHQSLKQFIMNCHFVKTIICRKTLQIPTENCRCWF